MSIAVASRTSGLPLAQAEALEDGDGTPFGSTEEMIAAAVLYGSVLGIGRDEALALLDRTIEAAPREKHQLLQPRSQTSDGPPPRNIPAAAGFGGQGTIVPVRETDIPLDARVPDETASPLPRVDASDGGHLPAHAQDVAANGGTGVGLGPLELDDAFAYDTDFDAPPSFDVPEHLHAPLGEPARGELESWVAERGTRTPRTTPVFVERALAAIGERIGEERRERLTTSMRAAQGRAQKVAATIREKMASSRHGVLIWAVAAGTLMVVLLATLASLLGGGDPAPPAPAKKEAPAAEPNAAPAKGKGKAAAPAPPLPRSAVTVDVLNAGGVGGKANELAAVLKERRYVIGDVGNSDSRYSISMILFSPGFKREATRLSKDTGITTLDHLPGDAARTAGKTHMVIVLV